jgi:hypothetical protein
MCCTYPQQKFSLRRALRLISPTISIVIALFNKLDALFTIAIPPVIHGYTLFCPLTVTFETAVIFETAVVLVDTFFSELVLTFISQRIFKLAIPFALFLQLSSLLVVSALVISFPLTLLAPPFLLLLAFMVFVFLVHQKCTSEKTSSGTDSASKQSVVLLLWLGRLWCAITVALSLSSPRMIPAPLPGVLIDEDISMFLSSPFGMPTWRERGTRWWWSLGSVGVRHFCDSFFYQFKTVICRILRIEIDCQVKCKANRGGKC